MSMNPAGVLADHNTRKLNSGERAPVIFDKISNSRNIFDHIILLNSQSAEIHRNTISNDTDLDIEETSGEIYISRSHFEERK